MSQTRKYVATCLIWTDRGPDDLKREIEMRLGPMLCNNGIGDLASVKVKAAVVTPNTKEEKWASTNS